MPGKNQRGEKQRVAVYEWKKGASQSEDCGGAEQNASRAQQSSEIDGEWPDEHQRCVVGAIQPGAVVEAYADMPLQIRKTETQHAAGERHQSRAEDDTKNSEQGTRRDFRWDGGGGAMRNIECGGADWMLEVPMVTATVSSGRLLPRKVRDGVSQRSWNHRARS